MKLKLTVLACIILSASAYAGGGGSRPAPAPTPAALSTPAPISAPAESSANKTEAAPAVVNTPPVAPPVVEPKPPLNKYGAVDANAKVPFSVQVPAAPANFTPPAYTIEANNWPGAVLPAPTLEASAYILMTANNGKVLAANNANTRLAPASMTKLMILYITEKQLAAGQIHLDDQVTVPTVAWATGGSRMFLKPNQKVSVRDLISGIIVDSGNDAAVTLASHLGGSQEAFVGMMNQEAKALGMTSTHFTDVMGLPAPAHYSTAYDMALLGRAIATQYPQYFSWFSQKSFSYNGITQANFNKLLFIYPYAQGMKTGSTAETGYSLVSAAQMPNNPMQLIAVVFNAKNGMAVATNSKALLTWGFRNFSAQLLYKANDIISNVPVKGGSNKTMPVTVAQDLYATIPNSLGTQLKADLKVNDNLKAPINKGDVVGTIIVTANGKPIIQAPAVAAVNIEKAGLWQRIKNLF